LGSKDLIPHKSSLIGFTGDTIIPKRYVDLNVNFDKKSNTKTIPARFTVVDCPSAYNARPTLNSLAAIVSTIHLAMKFLGENGSVVTVRGKNSDARKCYQESLKIMKSPSISPVTAEEKGKQKMEKRDLIRDAGVMMTNLDP
jgi:hypothetical protein